MPVIFVLVTSLEFICNLITLCPTGICILCGRGLRGPNQNSSNELYTQSNLICSIHPTLFILFQLYSSPFNRVCVWRVCLCVFFFHKVTITLAHFPPSCYHLIKMQHQYTVGRDKSQTERKHVVQVWDEPCIRVNGVLDFLLVLYHQSGPGGWVAVLASIITLPPLLINTVVRSLYWCEVSPLACMLFIDAL